MKKGKDSEGNQNSSNGFDISGNMIEETRKIIASMTETQRFEKAKAHIYDALNYKHPRF